MKVALLCLALLLCVAAQEQASTGPVEQVQISQAELAAEAAVNKQTIETFKLVDGNLQSISSDLLISSLDDANRLANAALRTLQTRRSALAERREACGRVADIVDRRSCFVQVFRLHKLLRRERELVDAMGKCNTVAGDVSKLVQCVSEMRLRHSLLSPDGVPKPVPGTETKAKLVASIEKAVSMVSSNSEQAEEEAEEAVAMIRKRLEMIASQWSVCKTLETPTMRIACRRSVVAMRDENKQERALLRRLERCGEIYAFEDGPRRRCAQLVQKQLLQLVRGKGATTTQLTVSDTTVPPVVNEAPDNLEDLKQAESHARAAIEDRISQVRSALRTCAEADTACKTRLHVLLARARDELEVLDDRFEPRKQCLVKRRAFQIREFKLRSLEHARLYQLHRKAGRCETRECLRRWERLELQLDVLVAKRRAARMKEWRAIRCFFVLPFSAVAPEVKTYSTLSGLHYRMHELYDQADRCTTRPCKEATEFLVLVMKHQIERLTRYLQERDFVSRIRRQRSRARANRKFVQLYRKALDCKSLDCRVDTRDSLVSLQLELDEEERQFDEPKIDHHVAGEI